MGSELTGKFFQNYFFNRVWPETAIIAEFAIKNCLDSTPQTSKMIFLDPIRARKLVFFIFNVNKSIQISSCLASPYWNAITIPPGSHPSLLAFYTSNMSQLNMGNLHPSRVSLRHSQSLYKTYIRDSLVSSFPLGSSHTQHISPPDNWISFRQKRQDLHFIRVFNILKKDHPNFKQKYRVVGSPRKQSRRGHIRSFAPRYAQTMNKTKEFPRKLHQQVT